MSPELEDRQLETSTTFKVPQGEHLMIGHGDWIRLRRRTGELGEALTDFASTCAAAAFGAAISLLCTIIALSVGDPKVPAGMVPSLWVAFGFSVLFAVCFGIVGRTTKKQRGENVDSVCGDMDDVAERAGHPGLGVEQTVVQTTWLRRTFQRAS